MGGGERIKGLEGRIGEIPPAPLKGQWHEIFAIFLSKNFTWAPYKQAKPVLQKYRDTVPFNHLIYHIKGMGQRTGIFSDSAIDNKESENAANERSVKKYFFINGSLFLFRKIFHNFFHQLG